MRINWIARLVARWSSDAAAAPTASAAIAGQPSPSATPSSTNLPEAAPAAASFAQTVLFIDIGGGRRALRVDCGDGSGRTILQWLLDTICSIVTEHGGRVVKIIGDEIMAAFDTPAPALLSAQQAHRRVGSSAVLQRSATGLRIGLHHGEVMRDSADAELFGPAVNFAARATSLAKREQTITTRSTVELLTAPIPAYRSLGTARFSGAGAPLEIVEVPWSTD